MPNAPTPTAPNEGFTVAARRASPASDVARIFLVLLALTFALRLPAFFVPVFNSDETFLATQAHVVEEGGQLYKDATDRKPPLVPYLYAATFEFFDTTALWSVRVVAMLSVALTALLLALEARRRWGERAGWMAGVLCVGAMVAFVPQDGQAANFEVFMLPFMTASILLARRGRGVAAGAAVAFATLAKQTGALTLLPVLYLLARARGREGISRVAIGFGVPLAVVALLIGPRSLFYWTVLGNGSYLGSSTASTRVIGMFLLMNLLWVVCNLPLVWRLPRAWRERDAVGLDVRGDTDLWLWAATAAVSVAIGLRFFGHYYIQLVPPLTLLTVGALSRGSRQLAARHRCGVVGAGRGLHGKRLRLPSRIQRQWLRVGEPLRRRACDDRRAHLRVGSPARDLLGVGQASRHPIPDRADLPHRQPSGTPRGRGRRRRRHPKSVAALLPRLHRAPTPPVDRHVARQHPGFGVLPDLTVPRVRGNRQA